MQVSLCQNCEQNLRKYYIGCLHQVYGQFHDHITQRVRQLGGMSMDNQKYYYKYLKYKSKYIQLKNSKN